MTARGHNRNLSRLRRAAHFLLADLLHYSGFLWCWFRIRRLLRGDQVCVLGLHRVLTPAEQRRSHSLPSIVLSDATFARLLEYLQRNFRVLSLDDLLSPAPAGAPAAQCVLTFDDGWLDNYTNAHGDLKRLGLPATILVATGLLEGQGYLWVERLRAAAAESGQGEQFCATLAGLLHDGASPSDLHAMIEGLKHMPAQARNRILNQVLPPPDSTTVNPVDSMMTWNQVRQMAVEGVEFGGHTVTHPLLPFEDDFTVQQELSGCKRTLEEKLQRKVRAFAYPNGNWDPRVRAAVIAAGYQCAFTVAPGWHGRDADPFTIHRILLHDGNVTGRDRSFSPAMFHLTLTGWL
ncbi:MAG: polysaccharide deacetylase family protein [Acidobacteria bacterium]|nr:polysaccharide deacetylase family protein [Acidobacteriota bacterium]